MPDTPSCTSFALSLLIAPKGDKHQISFGITKLCPDDEKDKPKWAITFLLEEKDGDKWKKRVDFKLDINVEAPAKTDKAEKIAEDKHLTKNQADFVLGPMYVTALDESRPKPVPAALLNLLKEEAEAFEQSDEEDVGREFHLNEQNSNKLSELLSEHFARRRRPGLKEMSIMFLDVE